MNVIVFGVNDSTSSFKANIKYPDACPYCCSKIAAQYLDSRLIESTTNNKYSCISFFSCPNCAKPFALTYDITKSSNSIPVGKNYKLIPPILNITPISDEIKSISPLYSDIMYQSDTALQHGLIDLAGMGYRKALECLLKDTLVNFLHYDKSLVIKLSLSDAINKFENNPLLQKASNQARVIGNDYTHYEAKYEDYDIETLRKLINIATYWLQMLIETESITDLPKRS